MHTQSIITGRNNNPKLNVHVDQSNQVSKGVHIHQELELVHIERGSLKLVIGDNVVNVSDDDLLLIGSKVPHVWPMRIDGNQLKAGKLEVNHTAKWPPSGLEFKFVKFLPNFAGSTLWRVPSMLPVEELVFRTSQYGLRLKGNLKEEIIRLMDEMMSVTPGKQLICLLQILEEIAEKGEYDLLNKKRELVQDDARVNKIISYLLANYHKKLSLEEVAHVVFLNKNSVCNYFRKHYNKTIFQVLHEIRIKKACYLLMNTDDSIENISSQTGYFSQALFNRKFKEILNTTPIAYRKKFRDQI